jgi:hypothetical protein
LSSDVGWLEQQVSWWITPKRKLRRQQHIGTLVLGFAGCRKNALCIALQITHQWIDLGEGKAHQQRLGCSP